MDLIALNLPKEPSEHIEEVHSNVGCQPSRLFKVAFPGAQVPLPTRGQVRQLQLIFILTTFLLDFLS